MDRNKNRQRQAYMRAQGYRNIPLDGSWGPYQQKIWDKLTTRKKQYDTTFVGFLTGLKDKLTGNDTYKVDPTNPGEITQYDPKKVDWGKTRRSQSKVVNALSGTWLPGAAVVATPALASAVVSAPIVTATSVVGGTVGGKVVNEASKALTGKDFATNVAEHTPLSPDLAETLNPGYVIGGGYLTKRMQNAIYSNVTPLGYGNMAKEGTPISKYTKPQELTNAFKDLFSFKKIDTNNPKWMQNVNENAFPKSTIKFRDDAWRLATGQKANSTMINGKPQSLYNKNPDGTYSYNLDYVRYYKNLYGENPKLRLEVPYEFSTVAHDNIATNAGFLGLKTTPEFSKNIVNKEGTTRLFNGKPQQYLGSPEVKISDTWDIQPFKDIFTENRSLFPRFAKFAQKHPNNPIVKYLRNFEAMRAIGRKPFTLQQTIPQGEINLYRLNYNLPK